MANISNIVQGCILLSAASLPSCLSSPIFSLLAGPAALPADAAAAAAAATLPVDAAAAAAAAGEADMLVEINLKKKLVQDFLPTIRIAQWS